MKFRSEITGEAAGGRIQSPSASGQLRPTPLGAVALTAEWLIKEEVASSRHEQLRHRQTASGHVPERLDRDRFAELAVAREHGP